MHNRLYSQQTQPLSPAQSEEYSDIIVRYQYAPEALLEELASYAPQVVDTQYSILHAPLSDQLATVDQIGYAGVPSLFTYIDTTSLEASGILAVQVQPFLNLRGEGVLIGFLDSGIDYTHPAFRKNDGTSRILRIWDQTGFAGPSPSGIAYGTEYTQEQINEALFSPDPRAVVPVTDEEGHGTAVAGIACGSPDSEEDFTGAAPESDILFVRLKPAKQYLRRYFLIPDNASAFQESDLMLGVRYLVDISRKLRRPLVICIALGSNQGGHTGRTPLEDVLTSAQFNSGVYVTTGTGNEVGQGHHFLGRQTGAGETTDIELLVNEETGGFSMEFWADSPELYSIGFTSPLGETIQPVQPRAGASYEFNFLLENSKINLTYAVVEMQTGSQLILMRIQNPTVGIWRIRVENKMFINGIFHLWLPIKGLIDGDTHFFSPGVDTTLVIPSCAEAVLSVGAYNAYNGSLFTNSGRGFTRNGIIKPEFCAPGVNVTAPAPGGRYLAMTGSCAASALAAGATALFAEGGLKRTPPRYFTIQEIKSLFLRGTTRNPYNTYPNREWGYGAMNIYGSFESFLQ